MQAKTPAQSNKSVQSNTPPAPSKTTPDNLAKPSPDNAGLAVDQPTSVDEHAAVVNRDVRALAKKSNQRKTRNSPEERKEKDL